MSSLTNMIRYAHLKHSGQVRKTNGRPYFHDHCLRLLEDISLDPNLVNDPTAALIILGHDIVEDCTKNDTNAERYILYDEIEERFGIEVQCGIFELTNEYTKARYPDLNRVQRNDRELKRLAKISERCKILKFYDRRANLRDLIADEDYNTNYARESRELVCCLAMLDNFHIGLTILTLANTILDKSNE